MLSHRTHRVPRTASSSPHGRTTLFPPLPPPIIPCSQLWGLLSTIPTSSPAYLATVQKVQTVIAGYIGVAPADNDWKVGDVTLET